MVHKFSFPERERELVRFCQLRDVPRDGLNLEGRIISCFFFFHPLFVKLNFIHTDVKISYRSQKNSFAEQRIDVSKARFISTIY